MSVESSYGSRLTDLRIHLTIHQRTIVKKTPYDETRSLVSDSNPGLVCVTLYPSSQGRRKHTNKSHYQMTGPSDSTDGDTYDKPCVHEA